MNTVINFVARFTGLGKAWDMMDGYKLYGTAALAILGALVGLGTEIAPILATHNTALLWAFLSHINSDPSYIALLAGFATIGAAHKADKAMAPAAPAAPAPVVVPPAPGA